jgi:uncharacterized protein YyaL (SSP411 family)
MLMAPPGAVLALGYDGPADGAAEVPLLAGRHPVDGSPAVYVCRNFTCRMPVTDPMELRDALAYPPVTWAGTELGSFGPSTTSRPLE